MAAEQQCFVRRAPERNPAIAGCIEMMLDEQALQFGFEPRASLEPGIGPGDTLRAILVGRESSQFFELLNCAFRIERQ